MFVFRRRQTGCARLEIPGNTCWHSIHSRASWALDPRIEATMLCKCLRPRLNRRRVSHLERQATRDHSIVVPSHLVLQAQAVAGAAALAVVIVAVVVVVAVAVAVAVAVVVVVVVVVAVAVVVVVVVVGVVVVVVVVVAVALAVALAQAVVLAQN